MAGGRAEGLQASHQRSGENPTNQPRTAAPLWTQTAPKTQGSKQAESQQNGFGGGDGYGPASNQAQAKETAEAAAHTAAHRSAANDRDRIRGRGGNGGETDRGRRPLSGLLIYYLNSQSILSKINELQCLAADKKPDLILVCESWCNEGVSNALLSVPGYQLHPELRKDRSDTANGIGGGLLVFGRKDLEILPCDQTVVFNQYVSFKVRLGLVTTTLYLVYRPPSITDLTDIINLVKSIGPNSILIGDFNLPTINWQDGTAGGRAREFLEATEEQFLQQLVDFPTHIRGNILDLVLTNAADLIQEVTSEGRLGKSDHEVLGIRLNGNQPYRPNNIQLPNWNRADWDGMRQELREIDWYTELSGKNTEDTWLNIKTVINDITTRYVPLKKSRHPSRPIWMNREITRAMDRKRRLWRHGTPAAEYKAADNKVRNLIRKAKRNFERKLAANHGNSKPFYSYLKNKTESRSGIGPLQTDSGTTSNGKEMATVLNNFFCSVFTAEDPAAELPDTDQLRYEEELKNVRFKVSDTRKLIKNLKTAGSPGPDKITARLLQQVVWEISPALTILFRKSLAEGTVPGDWKTANITPIYKKGRKSDPGNYRPVSLTSICGKLMEGHLKREIENHLKKNKLIINSQHGFMSGKSCTTNLLHFLEVLTKAVDNGDSVDVVYLDFSKAFDKVPHKKLLHKMRAHGITDKVYTWIENWLKGRKQRVVVEGECSDWEEVKSGVPQGSLLGPVLFKIHINDIDRIVELITLLLKFADDTKLAQVIRDDESRRTLQEALNALMAWAERWGMAFNTAKCKVMHVGRANPRYEYHMGGQPLSKTELERDIGVLVNSNLKPSDQCCKAAKTANSVLGQLTRGFHYRDRKTFMKLYKLYVRPHLEFAAAAWNPWTSADKETLEKVQKRAISMVSGLGNMNYEERLKELGMTTLEKRREELDLIEMYKIMSGKSDVDYNVWFTKVADAEGGRTTRLAADPLNVRVQAARLELRRNFFSTRVCEKWNSLPSDAKNAKSVSHFKSAYRRIVNHRT